MPDVIAVQTPEGVFCEGCLPPALAQRKHELFTIHDDMAFDVYPVCEACGERFTDVVLDEAGTKYELEVRGPVQGDVLLTETGAGGFLIELSLVEDAVVAMFLPSQHERLRTWIQGYLRAHPSANVWADRYYGPLELDDTWSKPAEALDSAMMLNRAR